MSNAVNIYPNPVKNTLYIGDGNEHFDVEIYTILGQVINSVRAINQIDVSSFDQGVYFLKIKTKNNTITQRIVKH